MGYQSEIYDWIVVRNPLPVLEQLVVADKHQSLNCRRCGRIEIIPSSMSILNYVAWLERFEKIHRKCKGAQ